MENENEIAARILAIDCAVGTGSVAVMEGGRVVATSSDVDGSPARAEEILQVVNALLLKSNTELRDLARIAVSVGPGSYSGIRIGLATAAGLSGALSVDHVGVSVLDAISVSAATEGKYVAAVAVGKRHIGWSTFKLPRGRQDLSTPAMQTDGDFRASIDSMKDVTILCDPTLTPRVRMVLPDHVALTETSGTIAELVGLYAYRHPDHRSLGPIYLRDEAGGGGQPTV